MTFAPMGGIKGSYELASFYADGKLSIPMYVRSLHINKANYDTALQCCDRGIREEGLTLDGAPTKFSDPTLYLSHDNLLTALQYASYRASIEYDPPSLTALPT